MHDAQRRGPARRRRIARNAAIWRRGRAPFWRHREGTVMLNVDQQERRVNLRAGCAVPVSKHALPRPSAIHPWPSLRVCVLTGCGEICNLKGPRPLADSDLSSADKAARARAW